MTRIILVGYMGAGKTTIGKALSQELGIVFYDLDWYIENRMRKTVAQIFAEKGEEGFRLIEFFDNMDYLNEQGQVIYLKATPEVLYKHLLMSKGERPLLKGKSPEELITFIREQLEKREIFYNKARYTLDVSLMDNYEKIKISIAKIRELLSL